MFCSTQTKIYWEAGWPSAGWYILKMPLSPLWVAAAFGLDSTVESLLQQGLDVNESSHYSSRPLEGDTALQRASIAGHTEVVRLLLQHGANPKDYGGKHGFSLAAATIHGHLGIVTLLLEAISRTEPRGRSTILPLAEAAYYGHEDIVRLLLKSGADVNRWNSEFGNPLQAASISGRENLGRLLLANGADVNAHGHEYSREIQNAKVSGRHTVVDKCREAAHKDIWLQLQKTESFPVLLRQCESPLHCAALHGNQAVLHLLLEAGANINDPGDLYGTALRAAAVTGNLEIVQILIHAGADVNLPGLVFGDALQAASLYGHDDIVRLLLGSGAKVKGKGQSRFYTSALQAATLRGHSKTAHLLLSQYNFIERPILWFYHSVVDPILFAKKLKAYTEWAISGTSFY